VAGGEEMTENSYDAYSATEPAIRQHIVRIRAGILLTQADRRGPIKLYRCDYAMELRSRQTI
jgi:hypothetical protein